MEKNIKQIVYDIMKNDSEVMSIIESIDQIYYQNDNEDTNRAEAKFSADKSIITFYRISEKPADYPKVVSLFQITWWNKDNLTAESLKNTLIECFHRRQNSEGLSYVELTDVGAEIYDKDIKVWGIPLTFVFIYRDVGY